MPSSNLLFQHLIHKGLKVLPPTPYIDKNWITSRSPVPVEGMSSASFLDHLYERGEKVLVLEDFCSQGDHLYEAGKADNPKLPRLTWPGVWFLVSPVDGKEHPNPRQDNKLSKRSEESVTSWRYLLLESDEAEEKDWLAILVQLPLKISAVYSSGGRSIHALVRLDASSKKEWDTMRNQIRPIRVRLGADAQAMTGVGLSRLPGAMRGLNEQELIYLNPNPNGNSILQ